MMCSVFLGLFYMFCSPLHNHLTSYYYVSSQIKASHNNNDKNLHQYQFNLCNCWRGVRHSTMPPYTRLLMYKVLLPLIVSRHTKEKINSGEYIFINYQRLDVLRACVYCYIIQARNIYILYHCISFCTCTNHTYIAHTTSLEMGKEYDYIYYTIAFDSVHILTSNRCPSDRCSIVYYIFAKQIGLVSTCT